MLWQEKLERKRKKTIFVTTCVKGKNRQMSIKVAQKWFLKKMIDFDTFTKIA